MSALVHDLEVRISPERLSDKEINKFGKYLSDKHNIEWTPIGMNRVHEFFYKIFKRIKFWWRS
jgi:hypothetical protein